MKMNPTGDDQPWSRLDYVSLAIALLSVILIVLVGMQLAGFAVLICAVMAWTKPFEENRAKGKPTLGTKGRIAVGSIMGMVATMLIVTHTDDEPTKYVANSTNLEAPEITTASAQADAEKLAAAAKLSPKEKERRLADLLAGERQLRREDVEGRLAFWEDIIALAPHNSAYIRQRSEIRSEVDALAPFRVRPELGALIINSKGRREGFGNVLVMDMTVRNRSLSNLKDFVIVCEAMGASGTVISTAKRTLFEVVKARSEKSFKDINMGFIDPQSKKSNCEIEYASVA